MSRHFFKTALQGEAIDILMGYDRPHDGFFMVIEKVGAVSDDYIFSNLFESKPYPKTIRSYQDKLKELGVSIPIEMVIEIQTDAAFKMGNKDVRHSLSNGKYERHQID